jgi:ribulose kinase
MALGAAIWAGLGAGVFKDYQEAIGCMVHIERAVAPVAERQKVYHTLYRQYVDLYPAVRATMHTLATQGS